MFVFFHYLLWKAKLNFDCLELKTRLAVYQRSIRSVFHCLLWRYENPSLHYTIRAYSLEHKKRQNIVIGEEEKYIIYVLQQVLVDELYEC